MLPGAEKVGTPSAGPRLRRPIRSFFLIGSEVGKGPRTLSLASGNGKPALVATAVNLPPPAGRMTRSAYTFPVGAPALRKPHEVTVPSTGEATTNSWDDVTVFCAVVHGVTPHRD